MEFRKNGKSIIITKDEGESDDLFFLRGWFIVSQDLFKFTIDELIKLSKIYTNINYLNCVYNSEMMEKIKNLEKNILFSI